MCFILKLKIKIKNKQKNQQQTIQKKYLAINNLCSCKLLGNKVTGVTQKMKIGAVCVMTYCLLLFMLFKSEIAKFGSVLLVYYALVILIVIFAFFLSIYNNLPKTNQLTKETNKQATKQTNKQTHQEGAPADRGNNHDQDKLHHHLDFMVSAPLCPVLSAAHLDKRHHTHCVQ